MKLYLARHGQSVGNVTGDFSTEAADRLTEKGWKQAHALAEHLEDLRIDHVYCSPLARALQTAYPFVKTGKRAEIWPELAESCWQDDKTVNPADEPFLVPFRWNLDLNQKYYKFRDGKSLQPAGDETYSQGMARVRKVASLVTQRHAGKNEVVLLLSHGYTIARLIELMLGIPPDGRFDHDNTGITCLKEGSSGFTVLYANRLPPLADGD